MTAAAASDPVHDQRSHILDIALGLMSTHGSAGTSMRRLATACDLNVATIYHYFPSKADLLQAVIAERRYGDRLAEEVLPIDPALPPAERFTKLFCWLWDRTLEENDILRLIVGEGLHGEETARRSARALIYAVDRWLSDVIENGFPELGPQGVEVVTAGLVRRQLLGLIAEHLTTGRADGPAAAEELATILFKGR